MAKVLVERPRLKRRSGDSRPGKGYARRVRDGLASADGPPTREGMKAPYGSNRKMFNENLAPLRRYLGSQVRRPWNKVYTEICAHIDRGNVVQKHILTHLFDYVVTQAILIDGVPCDGRGGYSYGRPLGGCRYRDLWYVCPRTGLLRAAPTRSRRVRPVPKPAPHVFVVSPTQLVRGVGDAWELLDVVRLPALAERGFHRERDTVLDRPVAGTPDSVFVAEYGRRVYAVGRRPLSKRELRRLPVPSDLLR